MHEDGEKILAPMQKLRVAGKVQRVYSSNENEGTFLTYGRQIIHFMCEKYDALVMMLSDRSLL